MREGLEGLIGERVRRVDLPAPELLAITLGRRVLVASIGPRARGVGLVEERPKGDPASSFVRKLRKELGGAALSGVDVVPGTLRLRFANGLALAIELDGAGNVILLDESDRVMVALSGSRLAERGIGPKDAYAPPTGGRYVPPAGDEELARAGAAIVGGGADGDELARARVALDRALRKTVARIERKMRAIEADAARADEAPALRADASAILASLHAIPHGASEARVTDWSADPPEERLVAIDPSLGAKGTADALFHRARRLERGREKAEGRRQEAERERGRIETLRARLTDVADADGIVELATEARKLGVRGAEEAVGVSRARERSDGKEPRVPFKRFLGHGDRPILVGRGAADNDTLTLRVAKPNDAWLHARGTAGAHVVVPLDKNEQCAPELLLDAAHLAAHFSDARGEPVVDVTHTQRRYVRKPRGFSPGAVAVDREKVIVLRVDPERLAHLLRTER